MVGRRQWKVESGQWMKEERRKSGVVDSWELMVGGEGVDGVILGGAYRNHIATI